MAMHGGRDESRGARVESALPGTQECVRHGCRCIVVLARTLIAIQDSLLMPVPCSDDFRTPKSAPGSQAGREMKSAIALKVRPQYRSTVASARPAAGSGSGRTRRRSGRCSQNSAKAVEVRGCSGLRHPVILSRVDLWLTARRRMWIRIRRCRRRGVHASTHYARREYW